MAQPERESGREGDMGTAARDGAESGADRRTQARPLVLLRGIGEPAVNEVLRTGARRLHSLPNDGRNPQHFVPDETGETFDAWVRNDKNQEGLPDPKGYHGGYHDLVMVINRENSQQTSDGPDSPNRYPLV